MEGGGWGREREKRGERHRERERERLCDCRCRNSREGLWTLEEKLLWADGNFRSWWWVSRGLRDLTLLIITRLTVWLLSRWNRICLLGRRIFSLSAHKDQPSESVPLVIECLSNPGVFFWAQETCKTGEVERSGLVKFDLRGYPPTNKQTNKNLVVNFHDCKAKS